MNNLRSRSGNGGHVGFFFDEAIPAALGSVVRLLVDGRENDNQLAIFSRGRLDPWLPREGLKIPDAERAEAQILGSS